MTKVYVDCDVILGLLLKRKEFLAEAKEVLSLGSVPTIQLMTSSLAVANVLYIYTSCLPGGTHNKKKLARQTVATLLQDFHIADVPGRNLKALLTDSAVRDVEDALQLDSAETAGAEYLITRNNADYPAPKGTLRILSPIEDLLVIKALKYAGD